MDWRAVLQRSKRILSQNPILIERNLLDAEAEQIVKAAYRIQCGKELSRLDLYVSPDPYKDPNNEVSSEVLERVIRWSEARSQGQILQHLFGYQTFLDHEYEVGPDVLVPRPETEGLVLTAISCLSQAKEPPLLGIEVGLGSGILSIELLLRFPRLKMISSEWSPAAQRRAQANAVKLLGDSLRLSPGADRLRILSPRTSTEVLEPFQREREGEADFIISNPPYLMETDSIDADVRHHEPSVALFAPREDPLFFYRKIAQEGHSILKPKGIFLGEVPHERSSLIRELFEQLNWKVRIEKDLTERDRVLVAEREE